MKKKLLFLAVLVTLFLASQNASAVFLTFEDPSLIIGATYDVGDSFYASGKQIIVGEFYPMVGNPITDGDVSIGNSGQAGAFGKELEVSNVNLSFVLNFDGCPACALALLFGEYGGDINLGIDGTIVSAADFYDLPLTINGASIFVRGSGALGSILIITGDIDTFTIGGQELYIDNVLLCEIPEPTTVILLGLGGLSLLAKRRNRR